MSTEPAATSPNPTPRWQPVGAVERRVLGTLVEKAKTTPDAYPMSLNALVTGCNQKNNRAPVTQLDAEAVEAALERLRNLGAVAAVHGSGRVERFRHYMYEWLGVDKVELAVMAELLLRGAQTVGDLRGRAARMEPIADLAALRPVLDSLQAKGLLVALSPEGRGQVVTHALYKPEELEKIRREHGAAAGSAAPHSATSTAGLSHSTAAAHPAARDDERWPARPAVAGGDAGDAAPKFPVDVRSGSPVEEGADQESLRRQIAELRADVGRLRADLSALAERVDHQAAPSE